MRGRRKSKLRGTGKPLSKDALQVPGRKPALTGQLPGLIAGLGRQRRPIRRELNFHDFRMCLPY
jgi:hypothetical protein